MASDDESPLRIGVTGGIASGKSTVSDMFAALGVPVIDTDVIAREIVRPGSMTLAEIRETFGDKVIADDGSLDRTAMRQVVFADDEARHKLESILHPRIRRETVQRAVEAGGAYQLIVVPLLVGSPARSLVDRVLVVDCDEETQIRRLLDRDTETEEQARRILAAQSSREARLAIADDVIENNGTLDELRERVLALHEKYSRLAGT